MVKIIFINLIWHGNMMFNFKLIKMKFEFVKATEITEIAMTNPEYKKNGYLRVFICPDVLDIWLLRILRGYGINDLKQ